MANIMVNIPQSGDRQNQTPGPCSMVKRMVKDFRGVVFFFGRPNNGGLEGSASRSP